MINEIYMTEAMCPLSAFRITIANPEYMFNFPNIFLKKLSFPS